MPLGVDRRRLGGLNLYAGTEWAFADAQATAHLFAAQASVVLTNAPAYWRVPPELAGSPGAAR